MWGHAVGAEAAVTTDSVTNSRAATHLLQKWKKPTKGDAEHLLPHSLEGTFLFLESSVLLPMKTTSSVLITGALLLALIALPREIGTRLIYTELD